LKTVKNTDKFQVSVEYLTEYTGVKGVVITDSEGLMIIQQPKEGFNGELCAAVGLELIKLLDKNLHGIAEPGCEFLSIKTGADWLTVAKTSIFYVIVLADRKADDLLNVRISRALEMISSYMKEKYPAVSPEREPAVRRSARKMEASNV